MPRKPKYEPIQGEYFSWSVNIRDGVYYANLRNSGYDRKRASLNTRDWDEAQENLKALDRYTALELGLITEEQARDPSDRVSIARGWDRYLEHCDRGQVQGGVSRATLKRYRAVKTHHVKFCRDQSINSWNDFAKANLRHYGQVREKVERAAARTVHFELRAIMSVNRWLIEEDLLLESARVRLKLSKPQGTDTYCYTRGQVTAMVAYCRATGGLDWLGDVIVMLAHTGLRISELVDLRWEDIHFQSQTIRIADERSSRAKTQVGSARTTKGKRSRSLPMHPQVAALLGAIPRHKDGFVLHAPRSGRLRQRNVLHDFIEKVIEPLSPQFPTPAGEIGFADGRLHSFRHYFCSQAFLGGAAEAEIRDWLGHAESKMVEHYRHLRSEDAVRRMRTLSFLDVDEDTGSSAIQE